MYCQLITLFIYLFIFLTVLFLLPHKRWQLCEWETILLADHFEIEAKSFRGHFPHRQDQHINFEAIEQRLGHYFSRVGCSGKSTKGYVCVCVCVCVSRGKSHLFFAIFFFSRNYRLVIGTTD